MKRNSAQQPTTHLIINLDRESQLASIYRATLLQQFKIGISILESAQIFQSLLPTWPTTPAQAEIIKPVVFAAADRGEAPAWNIVTIAPAREVEQLTDIFFVRNISTNDHAAQRAR